MATHEYEPGLFYNADEEKYPGAYLSTRYGSIFREESSRELELQLLKSDGLKLDIGKSGLIVLGSTTLVGALGIGVEKLALYGLNKFGSAAIPYIFAGNATGKIALGATGLYYSGKSVYTNGKLSYQYYQADEKDRAVFHGVLSGISIGTGLASGKLLYDGGSLGSFLINGEGTRYLTVGNQLLSATSGNSLVPQLGLNTDIYGAATPRLMLPAPTTGGTSNLPAVISAGTQLQIVNGNNYFGDMMNHDDSIRYNDFWLRNRIGSNETWHPFKEANPTQTIDDYFELLYGQSAWPKGYTPVIVNLQGGFKFEMAMNVGQENTSPGGFATDIGTIVSVDSVRNDVAVKYEWKDKLGKVVQFEVREGKILPVRVGPVGPQIDLELNRYLPGGANQYEMIIGRNENRMDYIKDIGEKNID